MCCERNEKTPRYSGNLLQSSLSVEQRGGERREIERDREIERERVSRESVERNALATEPRAAAALRFESQKLRRVPRGRVSPLVTRGWLECVITGLRVETGRRRRRVPSAWDRSGSGLAREGRCGSLTVSMVKYSSDSVNLLRPESPSAEPTRSSPRRGPITRRPAAV